MSFETSPTTAALDEALAQAQGEINSAAKNATNPHYQKNYANLEAVYTACREALAKHCISVTQWPVHSSDNRVHLVTRIAHKGEWQKSTFSIPVSKQDAHGYVAAVTYLRRVALGAAVGVVSEEDDDGNGTMNNDKKKAQNDQKPAAKNEKPHESTKTAAVVSNMEKKGIMLTLKEKKISTKTFQSWLLAKYGTNEMQPHFLDDVKKILSSKDLIEDDLLFEIKKRTDEAMKKPETSVAPKAPEPSPVAPQAAQPSQPTETPPKLKNYAPSS